MHFFLSFFQERYIVKFQSCIQYIFFMNKFEKAVFRMPDIVHDDNKVVKKSKFFKTPFSS